MHKNLNPRAAAASILLHVMKNQTQLDHAAEPFLSEYSAQDRALIKLLCFGTLRFFFQLEAIAKKLLHKPLPPKENLVHILLLVGLYQLYDTKIPTHAVVFSTVEAAKQLKKEWAAGLMNRLLRLFTKERERFTNFKPTDLETEFSHPLWFIDEIKFHYPKPWQEILKANNQHPPLWLRVNAQKISRADFLKTLTEKNIAVDIAEIPKAPFAVHLTHPISVHEIPGFFDGLCSVQDLAGQFLGSLLELNPNARVLDACAAPGSKATLLLEKFPDVEMIALDKDPNRLSLITENLQRLQLSPDRVLCKATTVENFAKENPNETFDLILLDAPCSATGVIRRHPDIKFLRNAQDILDAARQQRMLLSLLWSLVKPGGKLIYSTCSIFPEENEEIIETFLKKQSDVQAAPIMLPFGHATKNGWQILPGDGNADGFFYSVLEKASLN